MVDLAAIDVGGRPVLTGHEGVRRHPAGVVDIRDNPPGDHGGRTEVSHDDHSVRGRRRER